MADIDLTALNTTRPSPAMQMDPGQFPEPDLTDVNANVTDAEAGRVTAGENLDTAIGEVPQAPTPEAMTAQAPQRNIGQLMQASPWLMILAAMGGSRTQLSATNMMGAMNGMVKGLNEGDEEGYQSAYDKYQTEHQKWADLQKQKWDVYREMVKVYKDRIDGKQRALQVAEAAVRDARKDRSDTMNAWMQTVKAGVMLKDENRKISKTESDITDQRAKEAAARTEEERRRQKDESTAGKSGKVAAAKKEQHDSAVKDGVAEIDQLIAMLKQDKTTAGMTGLGGRISRGVEVAGNITGLSGKTQAAQFESRLSNLKLKVAPILASSNRTAKDQRQLMEKVARGDHLGDTKQNTLAALEDLKKEIQGTTAAEDTGTDKFEAGKTYTDAKGRTAIYQGNGQWKPQP
jgi:uncharacterized protein YgfB (UPF0149 family)